MIRSVGYFDFTFIVHNTVFWYNTLFNSNPGNDSNN